MNNKLIPLCITLVVGIILAGSVLMPVLNDATKTEETLENTGYYFMDKISSSDADTYTIKWDATTPGILTVNGDDIKVGDWGVTYGMTLTVFATETDMFRVGPASGVQTLSWIQLRGSTINYAQANSSFDATIENGTATVYIDDDTTAKTLTYTDAYLISADEADYVMKKANEPAYMLPDSPIYSLGYSVIPNGSGNTNLVLSVIGNVEDVDIDVVRSSSSGTVTFSDVEIVTTPVAEYVNVVKFDKITFVASEGGVDTDMVYSYVIVPHTITAELSEHLTPGQIALMGAIPIMVIIALLMVAVGVVARRND